MKSYYQPKGGKTGRYALRENTYRRTWYLIADYPYFKAVQKSRNDAEESGETEKLAVAEHMFKYDLKQAQCEKYISAIEAAMEKVPEQYLDYIMGHIIERRKYKSMRDVSDKTLKLWVQRFIWLVAHNLGDV